MEQMETAQRLAGCSFGVGGVPFWGKLRAFMEQMETVQRLAGYSFDVNGVPFWGKLRASMERVETIQQFEVKSPKAVHPIVRARRTRQPACALVG